MRLPVTTTSATDVGAGGAAVTLAGAVADGGAPVGGAWVAD
jgi:hypothetical protein